MTLAIINAMEKEHAQLTATLSDKRETRDGAFTFTEGELNGHRLVLAVSGIGKVNAAAGAVELIRRYRPDALLNTGVAGGIGPGLSVMDVVVGRRTIYHDVDCGPDVLPGQLFGMPPCYEADPALYETAMRLRPGGTKLCGGLICTGDQFITSPRQAEEIRRKQPEGLAVDMESCAIAQVCYLYKVPFLSFRIISDTPGVKNHFDQYLNFWDEMAARSFGVTQALLREICPPACTPPQNH